MPDRTYAIEYRALQDAHHELLASHHLLLVALEAVLTHITLPSDGPDVENCDNAFKQARDAIQQARKVRT